jgi:hypothetical protein
VLDGFVCALKLLELFEQYGLRHSKVLTYAATLSKDLTGLSSRFTHAYLKIKSQLMFRYRPPFMTMKTMKMTIYSRHYEKNIKTLFFA